MKKFSNVNLLITYLKNSWVDNENKDFMNCYFDFLTFLDESFFVIEIKASDDGEINFVLEAGISINGEKIDFSQIEFFLICYPLDEDMLDVTFGFEWGQYHFHSHFYSIDEVKDFFVLLKNNRLKIKQYLIKSLFGNSYRLYKEKIYIGSELVEEVGYPLAKLLACKKEKKEIFEIKLKSK